MGDCENHKDKPYKSDEMPASLQNSARKPAKLLKQASTRVRIANPHSAHLSTKRRVPFADVLFPTTNPTATLAVSTCTQPRINNSRKLATLLRDLERDRDFVAWLLN
jgi:hypothetical protein